MRSALERELKLAPPAGLDLAQLDGERAPVRSFESTYWDTEDRALLRRGVTIRRRVEGDAAAWQLKLPARRGRHELELPGGGEPPQAALDLLLALTRRQPLRPVARLRTARETLLVRSGEGVAAEVVLDAVTVLDGERTVAAFDELEIELVDGDEDDLRRLERTLRAAGAADAPAETKLARALGVEPPQPASGVRGREPVELLLAALRAQLEQIVAHDPGTRLGLDPEELHQVRVATRRLRAFLRAGAPLLDADWATATRTELAWLGTLLGDVRDHDVLIERLRGERVDLEPEEREGLERVLATLERERDGARARLLAGLGDDRYFALLERLEERPPTLGADVSLRGLWRREQRRAGRAVDRLTTRPDDDALHALRIRVKRARYAAELGRPALGKQGERYVEAAKALQDVLGEHQDDVVAEAALRAHVGDDVGAALAAGRLIERQRARRQEARAAWGARWRELARCARKLDR